MAITGLGESLLGGAIERSERRNKPKSKFVQLRDAAIGTLATKGIESATNYIVGGSFLGNSWNDFTSSEAQLNNNILSNKAIKSASYLDGINAKIDADGSDIDTYYLNKTAEEQFNSQFKAGAFSQYANDAEKMKTLKGLHMKAYLTDEDVIANSKVFAGHHREAMKALEMFKASGTQEQAVNFAKTRMPTTLGGKLINKFTGETGAQQSLDAYNKTKYARNAATLSAWTGVLRQTSGDFVQADKLATDLQLSEEEVNEKVSRSTPKMLSTGDGQFINYTEVYNPITGQTSSVGLERKNLVDLRSEEQRVTHSLKINNPTKNAGQFLNDKGKEKYVAGANLNPTTLEQLQENRALFNELKNDQSNTKKLTPVELDALNAFSDLTLNNEAYNLALTAHFDATARLKDAENKGVTGDALIKLQQDNTRTSSIVLQHEANVKQHIQDVYGVDTTTVRLTDAEIEALKKEEENLTNQSSNITKERVMDAAYLQSNFPPTGDDSATIGKNRGQLREIADLEETIRDAENKIENRDYDTGSATDQIISIVGGAAGLPSPRERDKAYYEQQIKEAQYERDKLFNTYILNNQEDSKLSKEEIEKLVIRDLIDPNFDKDNDNTTMTLMSAEYGTPSKKLEPLQDEEFLLARSSLIKDGERIQENNRIKNLASKTEQEQASLLAKSSLIKDGERIQENNRIKNLASETKQTSLLADGERIKESIPTNDADLMLLLMEARAKKSKNKISPKQMNKIDKDIVKQITNSAEPSTIEEIESIIKIATEYGLAPKRIEQLRKNMLTLMKNSKSKNQ